MVDRAHKMIASDYKMVTERFGRIDTGKKCTKCRSLIYYNKAGQKWCTACDWSNDHKLSASLRRIMN